MVLFANPAGGDARANLTVRASFDGGQTWSAQVVLWEGPGACSDLAALPDGRIACLFESGLREPYEGITPALFDMDALTASGQPVAAL